MTEGTAEIPTREFDVKGLPIHIRTEQDGSRQRLRAISKHPERLPDEIYDEIMELVRQGRIKTTNGMRAWFRATFVNADQLHVAHGLADNFRNLVARVGRNRVIGEHNRRIALENEEARRQEALEKERAEKEARAEAEAEIRGNVGEGVLERYPELAPLLLDGRLPDLMAAKDGGPLPVHEWTSGLSERFLSEHAGSVPALHAFLDRLANQVITINSFGVSIEAKYTHLKALIACGANPEFEATFKKLIQRQEHPRPDMQTLFYLDSIASIPQED